MFITGLVLSYPFLTHWVLPLWHNAPHLMLMLPPTLINVWLAWIFGRTLQSDREPLISTFARMERRQLLQLPTTDLPSDMVHYTRILTKIWSVLLSATAVISALLALSGLLAWWTFFTGVLSYMMVGVLFLGEYGYRRIRFAQYPHANPLQLAWFLIKSGSIWIPRTR